MIRRQEGLTRRKTIQGVLPASKWYLLSIQVIIIRTVQAIPQSSVMLLLPMAAAAAATEGVREVAVALTTRRTMVRTMPAETIEMAGVAKAVAVVVINRLQQIAIVAARTVMWIAAAVSVAAVATLVVTTSMYSVSRCGATLHPHLASASRSWAEKQIWMGQMYPYRAR